ncbi:hypothetical protein DFH29DRAFT_801606, partial [Suillus ampliporus]
QDFITFMDALKLRLRAKDQIHSILQGGGTEKNGQLVHIRLITLNSMKASEEITEEQSWQLLFDVDHAYIKFFRSLSSGKERSQRSCFYSPRRLTFRRPLGPS